MFCTNCGKQSTPEDKFCGGCGKLLSEVESTQNPTSSTASKDLRSSIDPKEVLGNARTVRAEYEGKKELEKPLRTMMNTGFAKERLAEVWSQKALVRLEGSAKESNILPREICFAEDSVIFIVANTWLARGTATALRKSEIQYIEVNGFESHYQFGPGQTTNRYWRLNFVTKWAGAKYGIPKGMFMAASDPTWYFNEGEVSFYLPLGKTNHQQEEYEQMYSEKLQVISAFYPVKFSNVVLTQSKSVGVFFGTGFWREIG